MVHQYQLNGYNIVLDSCSGSIHVVDEVAYDIVALFETHTPEEIVAAMLEKYGGRPDVTEEDVRGCIQDVQALKDAGKLFSPDTFADMAGTFKERSGDVVKALCLHVAHTCNLNCEYCFASQGKYHGDRALMSFEVGKQALDFLMDHSGTRRNLEVDFFGGEPLMNWDMVKRLVEYARSVEKERGKNFRFTLTTNGMLIDDDVIDFANREMSNVVLSLDGRKEINDRTRVDYAGNGSYDRIVPKFQKLVAARGGKGPQRKTALYPVLPAPPSRRRQTYFAATAWHCPVHRSLSQWRPPAMNGYSGSPDSTGPVPHNKTRFHSGDGRHAPPRRAKLDPPADQMQRHLTHGGTLR